MIEIKNLTKSYGSKSILHKWSYPFENGKIYGLIGRNGIGKTTLMKCISGLCMPDECEIHTEQGNVSRMDYLNRNINYISDEPVYYNDLTLYEHLWLVCRIENYKKEDAQKEIAFYVKEFHMEEYLNYYPSALSKGTLQRMMLIMGFLRKDANLLLDEPFNGLDPIQVKETIELCQWQKEKKCIIISSHDIESLGELCGQYLIFTQDGIRTFSGKINRDEVNRLIGESYV